MGHGRQQMPPTSSQQQTHSHAQNHLARDSVYARGPSTARVVGSPQHRMPVPDQPNYTPQPSMTPHYGPQPLFQDGFMNIAPTQFGRGNGTYWETSMNGFNYDTTGTFGIGAPPPWSGGEYPPVSIPNINSKAVPRSYFHSSKPQFPYGQFGQGGINHTGFPVVAEPLSNFATNFATNLSHSFPGTSATPSNQGASPVWKLSDCWVAYEVQDELHLTIVFRKVPSM
ncbi:hypothetical protein EDB92DRAFT_1846196 [Lactarius akahatsu]|uniref:Uncharacterized protein n=1 Tax=Lactarius akahatsu TaxID=416441 RepID=A0AAD4LJ99_9AGAM|nr:hypothetical protein EDB92DRAFT_1846196 [Lactarius akahatsu]